MIRICAGKQSDVRGATLIGWQNEELSSQHVQFLNLGVDALRSH